MAARLPPTFRDRTLMSKIPDAPVVLCPKCGTRMTAEDSKPIMFTDGLKDIRYVCTGCGTEAKRTVKGP
jgi:hypothetical protein